jgi:hypothetical protein
MSVASPIWRMRPSNALYPKATAAEADYDAALTRNFGSAADEARNDRARNGSRPGHPLHPLFVAKNESSDLWVAEAKTQRRQQLRGGNRASERRIIPIGEVQKTQQTRQKFATPPFIDGKNSVFPGFPPESSSCRRDQAASGSRLPISQYDVDARSPAYGPLRRR